MPLRYYQREAVDAVFDYWSKEDGNPLVDMATGCHARGTQILMHDGTTKPVELVAANDNVMGPDSKPRRVLSLARGREMMYRVTPVKGDPFVVNEGHIISLKTTNEGKKAVQYQNSHVTAGTVRNISVRDYVGKTKNFKHLHKLWRTGVDFDTPANDNLPVPAYIVGAMLGDGSLVHNAGLTNMDPEVIDSVCEYAKSVGASVRETRKPGNRASGYFFPDAEANRSSRNRFVAKLEDAGIWGMICDEKRIPHPYKTGSRSTRLNVLAGLLDTDGHLSHSNSFDFVSKSEQLSRDVVFVARSLGLAAYVNSCEKFCQTGGGGTYWRVSISGDTDMIPNRVERQKAKPRKQIKNPLVTGFTVEPVGVDDYFGFSLDGDHLYLTADFTVHHNTGKSMTLAQLFHEMITGWPDMRLICVTHVVELVEANFKEMLGIAPHAPVGVYAAGLGLRNTRAQILFAQLQSIYNKAALIGHVDVMAIDEVHLVPQDQNTMYRAFIDALLAINPGMKIVGLSATPYRLDSGRLDEGDDKLFDKTVYEYGIRQGIDDGYLTQITSKPTSTKQDTSSVPLRGNDLAKGALQKAVDKDWLNKQIVEEVLDTEGGRKTALFFCAGIDHATNIRNLVRDAGRTCEVLSGNTPKGERRDMINALKRGDIWAITNDNVMSTGTNVPGLDLIVDAAKTKSASRYVQRVGRGTRVVYPPGFDPEAVDATARRAAIAGYVKPNCRYMDFAGNISEHGPVDMIVPHKPTKGDGEAPIKICPQCEEQLHASLRVCWCCGHEFEFDETPKLQTHATDAPIISTSKPEPRAVRSRAFRYHEGKRGTPSVKVTYMCGLTGINEWLCPQHEGFAKRKADQFWLRHGGEKPAPADVLEWIERQSELSATAEIMVRPDGKYWKVERQIPANDNAEPAANDNQEWTTADMDDEIPF